MKKYLSFILSATIFLFCIFYINFVFAADGCSSNNDCGSGNCVAGQCYDNAISSPCLSNSACASKNCYAGRCCPETYPMGGSCPKKSMAKEIPVVNKPVDNISGETQTLDDPSKGEDTEEPKVPKDSGARFSGMTGQIEWCPDELDCDENSENWHLAKLNTVLPVYAHVKVVEGSAILSFSDMSTFVLKEGSHVVIDTPPGPESKIKLVAGNIWVNVKKMVEDGSMEIEMNQAVAGIKGTTFVLSDKDGISSIKVIEGLVDFTSKIDGRMEKIAAGEVIVADSNGLGTKGTFDISEENKLWEEVAAKIDIATEKEKNKDSVVGGGSNLKIISGIVLLLIVSVFIYIKIKK